MQQNNIPFENSSPMKGKRINKKWNTLRWIERKKFLNTEKIATASKKFDKLASASRMLEMAWVLATECSALRFWMGKAAHPSMIDLVSYSFSNSQMHPVDLHWDLSWSGDSRIILILEWGQLIKKQATFISLWICWSRFWKKVCFHISNNLRPYYYLPMQQKKVVIMTNAVWANLKRKKSLRKHNHMLSHSISFNHLLENLLLGSCDTRVCMRSHWWSQCCSKLLQRTLRFSCQRSWIVSLLYSLDCSRYQLIVPLILFIFCPLQFSDYPISATGLATLALTLPTHTYNHLYL